MDFSYVECSDKFISQYSFYGDDDISKKNFNRKYIGVPMRMIDPYP
jgi:hypothetical protein